VYGQTVAVLTNAHPYAATGANPAGMTLIKSDSAAPCVSPYSVVSMEGGVAYASPDGIVVVAPGGLQVATERVVSRGEWRFRYDPATLRAVQFGSRYLAITMVEDTTYPRTGLIYSPKDETSTWSEVQFVNQQQFQCLQHDIYSGIPYTIYNNAVYWLGLMSSYPEVYQWKSTEFVTPRPVNFGAFRIDFDQIVRYPEQGPEDSDIIEQYGVWNQARIEEPLDTINNHPVNGVRQVQLDPPNDSIVQNRQAVGGSPLFFLSRVNQGDVAVLLYGGRVLRYAKVITEPGIYRLPIGYKSDLWQIEFRGTADVHHFKIAETGKELAGV
jgi:hypothetical protein